VGWINGGVPVLRCHHILFFVLKQRCHHTFLHELAQFLYIHGLYGNSSCGSCINLGWIDGVGFWLHWAHAFLHRTNLSLARAWNPRSMSAVERMGSCPAWAFYVTCSIILRRLARGLVRHIARAGASARARSGGVQNNSNRASIIESSQLTIRH
jgi:hypothetical protein